MSLLDAAQVRRAWTLLGEPPPEEEETPAQTVKRLQRVAKSIEDILSGDGNDSGSDGDDEEDEEESGAESGAEEDAAGGETFKLKSTNGGCFTFLSETTAVKFMPWNKANVFKEQAFQTFMQEHAFLPTKVWQIDGQWIITAQPRLAPLPEEGVSGACESQLKLLRACVENHFFYMDIKPANFVYAREQPGEWTRNTKDILPAAQKGAEDYEAEYPDRVLQDVHTFSETDFGKPEFLFEATTTDVQQGSVFLIDLDAFRYVPNATHYQLQLKKQTGDMMTWQRFFAVSSQVQDDQKLDGGAVQVPATMSEVKRVVQTCLRQHRAFYDGIVPPRNLDRALTALQSSHNSKRFAPLELSESWMWWVEVMLRNTLEPKPFGMERLAKLSATILRPRRQDESSAAWKLADMLRDDDDDVSSDDSDSSDSDGAAARTTKTRRVEPRADGEYEVYEDEKLVGTYKSDIHGRLDV
jgi:hypothetical protein